LADLGKVCSTNQFLILQAWTIISIPGKTRRDVMPMDITGAQIFTQKSLCFLPGWANAKVHVQMLRTRQGEPWRCSTFQYVLPFVWQSSKPVLFTMGPHLILSKQFRDLVVISMWLSWASIVFWDKEDHLKGPLCTFLSHLVHVFQSFLFSLIYVRSKTL
jgi:hypothetical protein